MSPATSGAFEVSEHPSIAATTIVANMTETVLTGFINLLFGVQFLFVHSRIVSSGRHFPRNAVSPVKHLPGSALRGQSNGVRTVWRKFVAQEEKVGNIG